MLKVNIDYFKESENKTVKFKKEIKSKVFRVEGRNGSGKTLFLETLAYAFHTDPEDIKDESLRSYYSGFVNKEQKQKINFSVNCVFDEISVKSEKKGERTQVTINGEPTIAREVQNQFYVFFDSIKTPERQAEEYERECLDVLNSIEHECEKFQQYVNDIDRKNRNYSNAEGLINEQEKRIRSANNKLKLIEEDITKYKEKISKTSSLLHLWKIYSLEEDILQHERLISAIKVQLQGLTKVKQKNKELASEFISARQDFYSLINRIDYDRVYAKYLKRNNAHLLVNLNKRSKINEIIDALNDIGTLITKNDIERSRIEKNPEYHNLKFLKEFTEFIKRHYKDINRMYPEIYKKVNEDCTPLAKLEQNINNLKKLLDDMGKIKDILVKYVDTSKDVSDNDPICLVEDYETPEDLREKLGEHNEELKQMRDRLKELEEEKNTEIAEDYRSYDREQLLSELNGFKNKLLELEKDKEKYNNEILSANEAIRLHKKNTEVKPSYFEYKDKVKDMNHLLGSIIRKLSTEVIPVMEKIKNKRIDLSTTEKKISKALGLFFGTYQNSIIHETHLKKVKELDFIERAFVLEDDSFVYFKTNTGHIIVNTLLGKIRNLPNDRKSILLIDEASPLDIDNRTVLENELKKYASAEKIFLAAIAVPGKGYKNKDIQIIEC